MSEKAIRKSLGEGFVNIIMKHGNASWATSELLWLVYDKHKCHYDRLNEHLKCEIDSYMMALKLLHGGN